jgi:ribonuclease D
MAAPWIRTADELAALCGRLQGASALALDSESDSLHHYKEKVCLVQMATDRGEAVLLDPLLLRDLRALAPVLADPAVTKVLHGADYDVTTLKRDFGFAFASLFDTMIAARFLGLPEIGLQAVVRAELGVALSKDSQKDDWSVRPLLPRQEAYALADVQHLLALHARLADKLEALSRLDWVLEESAAVAELPPARRERDPEAWQAVKGARRLRPRALAVLRELFAWREQTAEARDLPAFKVLGTEPLLELAEKAPGSPAALRAVRGLPPRVRDQPVGLLDAVARALALPERDLPRLPRLPPRPGTTEPQKRREAALKAWRTAEAQRLAVDVSVVLPQRLIDKLAVAPPVDEAGLAEIAGLRRWRQQAFGSALLASLRAAS